MEKKENNETQGLELTIRSTVEVNPQPQTQEHTILGLHIRRSHHKRIHVRTPLDKRQQRPLVYVINIRRRRPRPDDVPQQRIQRVAHTGARLGRAARDPKPVQRPGDRVEPQLGHQPAQRRRRRGGEEDAREPAQRGLADGKECRLLLALSVQPDGFQRADVPRHEGENGHADAALDQDAEVRQLEEARRGILGRGRGEEIAFPAAGEVG